MTTATDIRPSRGPGPVPASAAAGRASVSQLTRQRRRAAWIFLLPMLLILALVAGWPLLRTIYFSFTDATLYDLEYAEFIGFLNFYYLAVDPQWWRAVWNTVFFAVSSVVIETVLGMIIALTLNAHMPGRGLLRAAVLIPWAIPTVVSAQMWGWMYHDLYGIINEIFLSIGLIDKPYAWIADPNLAMYAVIAVDVWKTTPFMTLLILAALQLLPNEVYEAARVDGISPVKVFFKVTLPLIKPALMVAIIFRTLDSLRIFDLMYVLTGNSRSTASMSVYARQQLVDFQDVGYGSAASTFLFLIIAAFTVIYITVGKVNFDKEGR
jgi:trehalose/maltose transport system permease protein